MTVATDLQDIVAEISVHIAEGRQIGRVELEKLRRNVSAVAAEARAEARRIGEARLSVLTLVDAIDTAVVDLPGLSRRTRERLTAIGGEAA